jgi:hypothetical protein
MPAKFEYPSEPWSQRKLRTRGDVELAMDIQRRTQSSVPGWDAEAERLGNAGEQPVEQGRKE